MFAAAACVKAPRLLGPTRARIWHR